LRIIKDYDMYVERNLRRDYSPSDMGISEAKAMRIKIRRAWANTDSEFKSKFDFYWKTLILCVLFYLVTIIVLPYLNMKSVK